MGNDYSKKTLIMSKLSKLIMIYNNWDDTWKKVSYIDTKKTIYFTSKQDVLNAIEEIERLL
jgi:ADP-dependent phosphofructokinase/glucokinase